MAKDPVCGMEVDEKKAKFSTMKDGKKYYFCSKNCYDKFNKISLNKNSLKNKSIKNLTIFAVLWLIKGKNLPKGFN